jgi:hypothetical protein
VSLGGWLREQRDPYLLGLLRVAIALLLLLQTLKLGYRLHLNGYFGDVFHMPLVPSALVPSHTLYAALLALQALGCVLALVGVAARPALLVAALLGLYLMACDRLQYHNNRYVLLLVALLLPFTPCSHSFVPPWRAEPRPGALAPRWAAYLIGAQLSLVYLSSSVGKLLDHDWRSGLVMQLRFAHVHDATWVPETLRQLATTPAFAQLATVCALASELFLALGVWFPRTRVLALWLGVVFHAGIEAVARVELFSYTMLCSYLVFARPELHERRLLWSAQRSRLRSALRKLDWLRRFRHEQTEQTDLCVVVDREGREHRGLPALRELARATPLLFPLWLPLRLLTWRSTS